MRISRLTVDKLGVKLYDKVSAVIAELIANAYDADAIQVTVRAPIGQFLATRAGGAVADKGDEAAVAALGIENNVLAHWRRRLSMEPTISNVPAES